MNQYLENQHGSWIKESEEGPTTLAGTDGEQGVTLNSPAIYAGVGYGCDIKVGVRSETNVVLIHVKERKDNLAAFFSGSSLRVFSTGKGDFSPYIPFFEDLANEVPLLRDSMHVRIALLKENHYAK